MIASNFDIQGLISNKPASNFDIQGSLTNKPSAHLRKRERGMQPVSNVSEADNMTWQASNFVTQPSCCHLYKREKHLRLTQLLREAYLAYQLIQKPGSWDYHSVLHWKQAGQPAGGRICSQNPQKREIREMIGHFCQLVQQSQIWKSYPTLGAI